AQQQRDLCSQRSRVQVRFIKHDSLHVWAKEDGILRTAEHVLEHGVVRDHNVGDTATPGRTNTGPLMRLEAAGLLARAHTASIPYGHALPVCPLLILARF